MKNTLNDINKNLQKNNWFSKNITKTLRNQNKQNNANSNLKIKKLISLKEKINPYIENLLKEKFFTEKYIPKNKTLIESNNNTNIKEEKKILKNINSNPIKNKILYIQKKIEKNSAIIRSLSEENRLFQKRYKKAIKLQEKNNLKKKLIILNNNKNNNFFNKSIILINEDSNMNELLLENNINECKEDLKIIEKLKDNYNEGKNIEYPFYILDNINKKENKKEDIPKIKGEIERTKISISDLDKNSDFDYNNLDKDKKKVFDLIKNKIKKIDTNKQNKRGNIKNSPFSLSLTDNKGTYQLVTKCEINNKNKNNINYNKMIKEYNSTNKYNLYDFYNEYNRVKKLLGPTNKSKNSSAFFILNRKFYTKKKLTDKEEKFHSEENEFFNSINLSLDSNNDMYNKSFDINNIYSYLKYNNHKKTKILFSNYIKKYHRKYDIDINNKELGMKLNPLMNDIKKNSLKYNISNKLKILDYNKFIDLNLFKNKKRKFMINKIQKLDEKMKNIDYDSIEGILDLNQDLIL